LRSKTYIVAWDGAINNVLDISRQLENSELDHVFYNVSSVENKNENWQSAQDVRYYGHFFNGLSDFINNTDSQIFIFNAGDVASDRHADYIRYIEKIFSETPNLALYAPETDHDVFSGIGSFIKQSSKYENLFLSTNTNGMYVAMSRQIASYIYLFYLWSLDNKKIIDFSKMVSGWGLDMCYCSLAMILNKGIYRDSMAKMHHPKSQSYTQQIGSDEYTATINSFRIFCQNVLNINSDSISIRMELTIYQVRNQGTFVNSIEELYSEPSVLEGM
jgi:hypothetical protein